jgi:hypothetical protein
MEREQVVLYRPLSDRISVSLADCNTIGNLDASGDDLNTKRTSFFAADGRTKAVNPLRLANDAGYRTEVE